MIVESRFFMFVIYKWIFEYWYYITDILKLSGIVEVGIKNKYYYNILCWVLESWIITVHFKNIFFFLIFIKTKNNLKIFTQM